MFKKHYVKISIFADLYFQTHKKRNIGKVILCKFGLSIGTLAFISLFADIIQILDFLTTKNVEIMIRTINEVVMIAAIAVTCCTSINSMGAIAEAERP